MTQKRGKIIIMTATKPWDSLWNGLSSHKGFVIMVGQIDRVKTAFEVYSSLTFVLGNKEGNFGKGAEMSPKNRIRFKDKGAIVPKDGTPFVIISRMQFDCLFGRDKHLVEKKKKTAIREAALQSDHLPVAKRKIPSSKKKNCKAKIIVLEVLMFPDFKLPEGSLESEQCQKEKSRLLRDSLATDREAVTKERRYYISLPQPSDHEDCHPVSQLTGVLNPVSKEIRDKIYELVSTGISTVDEIKRHLKQYVSTLFPTNPPPLTNRAYHPPDETLKKHIYLCQKRLRNSQSEEENLLSVAELSQENSEDRLEYIMAAEEPVDEIIFQVDDDDDEIVTNRSSAVETSYAICQQSKKSRQMQKRMQVYLDYNATTPLEPAVLESISTALQDAWGNPSSSHDSGKKAKICIDDARNKVATMIGADPTDIVFVSGGTEGNNMILQTAVQYFHQTCIPDTDSLEEGTAFIPNIISSKIEHPAVNEYLEHLHRTGQADITYVPVSHVTGRVEAADIVSALKSNTIMVTVMLANNETGIIQNVSEICQAIKSVERADGETSRILVHTDAAQAIGKIPVDVKTLGVDYLTVVGHKFYGPRIGAVYSCDLSSGGTPLFPMLFGGGQERNFRPGTENTGMIAGLGKACQLVTENLTKYSNNMRTCRSYLEEKLEEVFRGSVHFNGKIQGTERLPNTCNFSLLGSGLQGFQVLSRCKVLQASIGAACHSQSRVSSILTAIGVEDKIAMNALRLSVGRSTTKQDIDLVIDDLIQAVHKLVRERS